MIMSSRKICLLILLLAAALGGSRPTHAEAKKERLDTEHLFGFLTGTDIGEVGEIEFENTTVERLGKRSGSYGALSHKLALEYVPVQNLRVELSGTAGYHTISGVSERDSLNAANLQGLSVEVRYRLLRRERAAFGLTLLAEPRWSPIEETTGKPANQLGVDLAVLADQELIPNRLVAAINAIYTPEVTKSRAMSTWSREANLGLGAGVMMQMLPGLFLGAEGRYIRAYQNLGLDAFAGHAVFLGPNLSFELQEKWRFTLTWAAQVAGRAVGETQRLDLTNFERHQFRLRIGYDLN
jgi:hypothetical protein